MNGMITADKIKKNYLVNGQVVQAIDGVSLELSENYVAFCGASGAGKSTLLYILGGLGLPDSGTVKINDVEITSFSEDETAEFRRKNVGFVFQFFYLMPVFTVLENVLIPLYPTALSAKEKLQRAMEVIDQVGMSHRHGHLPTELSAGEQQRTGIARAMVNKPSIIFADEPTSDLDKKNVEGILSIFDGLRKTGVSIILATHDNRVMERVDRLIELEDGKIVNSK